MPAAASSFGRKRNGAFPPSFGKKNVSDYGFDYADQCFLAAFFIGFGVFFTGAVFFA
jgi:hypothetical protein